MQTELFGSSPISRIRLSSEQTNRKNKDGGFKQYSTRDVVGSLLPVIIFGFKHQHYSKVKLSRRRPRTLSSYLSISEF